MRKKVIRGIYASEQVYEKQRDSVNVCSSIMRMHYNQADKMKLSRSTVVDLCKTASFVNMNNLMIYIFELAKAAAKQGMSMEEFVGEIQIELQETWGLLSKTKMGIGAFGSLEIDDVINNNNPFDLFKKGAIVQVEKIDRIEEASKKEHDTASAVQKTEATADAVS